MRIMYGLLIAIEIILMGICSYKAMNKKGRLAKIVFIYEVVAAFCGIVFLVYIYVPGITITTLCKSLTLICFDWILILLMYYTQYYTGLFHGVKIIKEAMIAFSAIDSVMLIANVWNHQIFTITEINDYEIVTEFVKTNFFYKAHFIYNYLVILLLLLSFMFMIANSSKFYSFRYEIIFIALLIGFILDIVTIRSQSIYDVSMPAYGIMCMLIYYFTLRYIPNELIENTLSLIIKDMNSGIVCFDNRGRCIYCNDILKNIYNIGTEYIDVERKYSEWLNERGSDRKDTMKTETTVSFHDIKKYYEVVYKRIFDDKNNFVCDYFIFNDKTEDIQSLEKEKYKATHDRLTGLYNKDQFYIETYKILHRNADVPYCMLCSNIRDFKFVNELFGIEKGNEVLVKQAEIMKEYASDDVIAARINSDRFAMLIPKKSFSVDMILSIIHRMQDYFKDSSFHLHIFTGVYDISDLEEPVSIMCDKANLASETIKNEYKSNIAYYTERLFESSIEERRIIGEFERAISNNEFEMYLQPQVDSSGNLYGAEALVRWQHPERGLLSPAIFIDVLEKTGFIYRLDRYMWDKAAKKLSEWKKEGKDQYHISVNISTKDFYLVDVYETFVGLVDKYDIDPVNLKIEITETTLMSDLDKNMGIIRRLQNYGFNIEIDDFGSGYSSLNMLKDISADVLKIDMGFLRASENEAKGLDILESIITLAGKLGMKVITEGVETKKQLYMLAEMGCDMYQGYYFSKPIPVDEFEKKYNIK